MPNDRDPAWDAVEIVAGSNGYRLPTEAQGEYAAKGGNQYMPGWVGYTYAGSNNLDSVAWWGPNGNGKTHEVGKKAPNALGLYDMSGNVNEILWDWHDSNYYMVSPEHDPMGPSSGSYYYRVNRSGVVYYSYEQYFRSVYREGAIPDGPLSDIGFRVVRPNP